MSFLTEILRHKRLDVSSRNSPRRQAHLKRRLVDLDPTRGFAAALRRPAGAALRLIAEIKKASPSKGLIREDFDPVRIAASYASAGAQAVSVLTDREFFQGDLAYLAAVRAAVTLPILEKDFVIDEFQIYEARVLGADAVLLIAAALEGRQIEEYLALAAELGLSALVEVHDERELERVAERAMLIGINNRDLATFVTDLTVTERVMREMPAGRIVVSESGIVCRDDVRRLADLGVDAVLIGETFMRAAVIEDAVRDLMTPEAEPTGSRAGRRKEPGAVAR
ncbi:MAG: indole-3-glycerol phosphate synthase TrpC [Nitrospiria bacterium]